MIIITKEYVSGELMTSGILLQMQRRSSLSIIFDIKDTIEAARQRASEYSKERILN